VDEVAAADRADLTDGEESTEGEVRPEGALHPQDVVVQVGEHAAAAARTGEQESAALVPVPFLVPAAGALFDATQEIMEAAGLPAYEISNHARPGQESRHNLAYWTGGAYLGIGPGAHGRLTREGKRYATRKHRAPEVWPRRVGEQGHASQGETPLAAEENLEELLLMGLRLRRGVAREDFRRLCGAEPESLLDAARLRALSDSGDLQLDDSGLRATAAGRARLNALLGYLLT